MIVDNVDREYGLDADDAQAYDIAAFLPPADHGSVLITTRLASLGDIGPSTQIQRLDPQQALELLSDRSGLAPSIQGSICPDSKLGEYVTYFGILGMQQLVQRLGCLPLALVQAGRYIWATGTSCRKYLELYESSWSRLIAEVPRLRE